MHRKTLLFLISDELLAENIIDEKKRRRYEIRCIVNLQYPIKIQVKKKGISPVITKTHIYIKKKLY